MCGQLWLILLWDGIYHINRKQVSNGHATFQCHMMVGHISQGDCDATTVDSSRLFENRHHKKFFRETSLLWSVDKDILAKETCGKLWNAKDSCDSPRWQSERFVSYEPDCSLFCLSGVVRSYLKLLISFFYDWVNCEGI